MRLVRHVALKGEKDRAGLVEKAEGNRPLYGLLGGDGRTILKWYLNMVRGFLIGFNCLRMVRRVKMVMNVPISYTAGYFMVGKCYFFPTGPSCTEYF
jgi:hypothetical protein